MNTTAGEPQRDRAGTRARASDPRLLLTAMQAGVLMAVTIGNGPRLAGYIRSVVALIDGRCVHCGYMLDHPFIVHGPPCLVP